MFGITILPIEARTPQDISNAFAAMASQNTEALIVPLEGLFQQEKNQILGLVAKQRLPSIAAYREYVEAGGLISYGQSVGESYRRAATYIDKIFKGANPGELPVEQPTKFELFINMKTAKALGIKVPQSLLVQATKVIE
jgi:putative ABC transport system substrate-binding protein